MEFVLDLGVSEAATLQQAVSQQSLQHGGDSTLGSVTHNYFVIKLD